MTARSRVSLDGQWRFWADPQAAFDLASLERQPVRLVQVPAPLQSQLPDLREYSGPAWYRPELDVSPGWFDGRVIVLGFGAADYAAEVWLNLGAVIPGDGRLGWECAAITPEHVLALFGTRPFAQAVWAALFSGWRRCPAAFILRLPVGRGTLIATTFRLRDPLGSDPVAAELLAALIRALV